MCLLLTTHQKTIPKLNSAFTILKANMTFIRRKPPSTSAGLQASRFKLSGSSLLGKGGWARSPTRQGRQGSDLADKGSAHSAQTKSQSRASDGSQGQWRVQAPGQGRSDKQVRGEAGKSCQWVRISKGRCSSTLMSGNILPPKQIMRGWCLEPALKSRIRTPFWFGFWFLES